MGEMPDALMAALQHFETAEANLIKLERLWDEIWALIPSDIEFTSGDSEYEDRCRAFDRVLAALPLIDGWKPNIVLPDLNGIAQDRFDAMELGELSAKVSIEAAIGSPGREIQDYRFRFNQKRRTLIRDMLTNIIDQIDTMLEPAEEAVDNMDPGEKIPEPQSGNLRERVAQIDVLLGSAARPTRWNDLQRHLAFGLICDLNDIQKLDWPQVKGGLKKNLYGENEPLPTAIEDLGDLVATRPRGNVVTKLAWSNLDDDGFERLIFNLINATDGYENPEWLTRTNAPDRGRDLSVARVIVDGLSGTRRSRVIIQCRHWAIVALTNQFLYQGTSRSAPGLAN